jgi:hypothetical protein
MPRLLHPLSAVEVQGSANVSFSFDEGEGDEEFGVGASPAVLPPASPAVPPAASPVSTASLTKIQTNATATAVAMEMASAQPSSTLASKLTAPASASAVEVQGAANHSISFDGGEGGEEYGIEKFGAAAASSSAMSTAPLTQKHLADNDDIGKCHSQYSCHGFSYIFFLHKLRFGIVCINMASAGGATGDDYYDEQHSQGQVGPLRRSKRKHTSQYVVPSKNNQSIKSAKSMVNEILKTLPAQSKDEVCTYEEETAWRFHNPNLPETSNQQLQELRKVTGLPSLQDRCGPNELKPLPKALPVPSLPDTGFCKWSFNNVSRVLLANFCASSHAVEAEQVTVLPEDEEFLLQMMERDDITVISQGLADAINPFLYSNDYIKGVIGPIDHHKVRRFTTTNGQIKEAGWHSMKFEA